MHDIQILVSRLVGKAQQLLGSENTNLAECWMHIRAKFDGGKVITALRVFSGSIIAWVLVCNKGVWSSMTGSPPNQHFIDMAECFAKKADNDRKRKATDTAKQQQQQSKYS